jgi:hypothetical protein
MGEEELQDKANNFKFFKVSVKTMEKQELQEDSKMAARRRKQKVCLL